MHILLSTLKYLLGLGLCTLEYVVPESTSEYMYILQITSTYVTDTYIFFCFLC
jgi:hypothetical protein